MSRLKFLPASRHHIDSRILIGFLILAAGILLFLKGASEVMEGDTSAFDRAILLALRNPADTSLPIGPGWLQTTLIDVTALGGVTVLTLLTILTAGYLLARRKPGTALFVTIAIGGGAIVSTFLKMQFARARPDLVAHLVDVHNASFPSGHAMNSAVTYLTLGVLLARSERSNPVRIYLVVVAILLTLIIGASRVYLGVHWPSDVIAGWCVGAIWAALCSLVARGLQRRHAIEAPSAGSDEEEPPELAAE